MSIRKFPSFLLPTFAAMVVPSITLAFMSIAPGPAYDPVQDTGLVISPNGSDLSLTSGQGHALCTGQFHLNGQNLGTRTFRWDASGVPPIELANLGVSLTGATAVRATAMNASGTVVGYATKFANGVERGNRAVLWDAAGVATELKSLSTGNSSGNESAALGINNLGMIVGSSRTYANDISLGDKAVFWNSASAAPVRLGHLGETPNGTSSGSASLINDAGVIIGITQKISNSQAFGDRAVRWRVGSALPTELGNLGTSSSGYSSPVHASAINSDGTAVGSSWKYVNGVSRGFHAARWDISSTAALSLGELEPVSGDGFSDASDINDAGEVVGNVESPQGLRAVAWHPAGAQATTLLGLRHDIYYSQAFASAVNSSGFVVGEVRELASDDPVAVLWRDSDVPVPLKDLISPASGWAKLTSAFAISDDFWVSGVGVFDPDGNGPLSAYNRAFLLQVPEPATAILTMGLAASSRSRRRVCVARGG